MELNIKKQRKIILSDPIKAYSDKNQANNESNILKLKNLQVRYLATKDKHKEIHDRTKELSRKIGEARNTGVSIKDLKVRMQEYSTLKSKISQQLLDIESEIFSFFDITGTTSKQASAQAPPFNKRVYAASSIHIDDISISMLQNEHTAWNNYAKNHPASSIYHLVEWRQLIKTSFGHDSKYFYATDSNNIVRGILPLVQLNSRLFGNFIVSMPYFNYGGAIADHPQIERKLMQAAQEYASRVNASHIEFRDDIERPSLPVRSDKVNMILPLPPNTQELWDSFTPKLRAQIKRPQKETPLIQHGGLEYLNDFYRVFSQNMRDLGTPVYSKSFFANILNTFGDHSSILTIQLQGKPVAAAFLIGYGDTLEIPWASTLRKVNHLSINMLMYWEILTYAIQNKYKFFDFGRSSKNAGTYKFKKQWGAMPKQLYWHYWLCQGMEIPSLNPSNPKYRLAIAIWKRLPLTVTNLLGPFLVKNLP